MRSVSLNPVQYRVGGILVAVMVVLGSVVPRLRADDSSKESSNAPRFEHLDRDGNGAVSVREFLEGIPAPELEAARRHFYSRDGDADGSLSPEELASDPKTICPHYQLFVNYDVDKDDRLGREEYVAPARPKYEQAANSEFDFFDRNSDGVLTYEEFVRTPRVVISRDVAFRQLDFDGNHKLSPREFLAQYAGDFQAQRRSLFFLSDIDDSGELSLEEFLKEGNGTPLTLRRKYKSRDFNEDGQMDREEYARPLMNTEWERAAKNEAIMFDTDDDGVLSILEFAMTPQDRFHGDEQFPLFDADTNQLVDLREFLTPRRPDQRAGAEAAFCRSDSNQDGRLNREEFLKLNEPGLNWPDPFEVRVSELLRALEPLRAAADADGDGRLSAKEWPAKALVSTLLDVGEIPFRDWDRDQDGYVSAEEQRKLIEIAYGVRHEDGKLLLRDGAQVLNWAFFRALDKNRNGMISRAEFVGGFYEGPKNAERFADWDKDRDGRLTLDDLAASVGTSTDMIHEFAVRDSNGDARLTDDEIVAHAAPWQKGMAPRLVAAFDRNGDGLLDPAEYLWTPFANTQSDWYIPRTDLNLDGRLSPNEFCIEKSPFLFALSREIHRRFDRNHDGGLTVDEFDFPIDLENVPAAIAHASLDRNRDGQIRLGDFEDRNRPDSSDPSALLRWEEQKTRFEEAFLTTDRDQNGAISMDEFESRRPVFIAAVLGRSPPTASTPSEESAVGPTSGQTESWNWRLVALVTCNIAVLGGIGWFVFRPSPKIEKGENSK